MLSQEQRLVFVYDMAIPDKQRLACAVEAIGHLRIENARLEAENAKLREAPQEIVDYFALKLSKTAVNYPEIAHTMAQIARAALGAAHE